MHAIQTSGNCIRNVTADHFAGAVAGEIEDPRILAEIIRQWSSLHPEFTFLPRKFKIAVSGTAADRAAVKYHDIGIEIVNNDKGATGYRVLVGGGMGRTPYVARCMRLRCQGRHPRLSRGDPARLQPVGPPGQYLQGAHQDPGQRAGDRGDARAGGARIRGDQARGLPQIAARRDGAHRGLFRPAGVRGCERERVRGGPRRRHGIRRLVPPQPDAASRARLRHRHDFAQAHRRGAGRCHRRADGRARRSDGRIRPRRIARQP